MNPAIVVIIVLLVAALLIWACKAKKLDGLFNFGDPYYTSTVTPSVSPTTVLVTPPVPAAYPMYDVNYRYPFGVPWDIDVDRRRRYNWGRWRR
ncbi:putative protein 312R [Cricket iridovirus]|uniref:Uncharacterized protein 312R n=3 Tax=Iridoviridae TaxID=10486 RepID=312R_IIV6|nr:312R [Invertebrate iridescent virus 6]Q91FL2.1 RecName: Full=Uncharacterized protein 312R; Flags: Precursor [Invertebrate iridescent virus 6]QEA08306.1 putative protein 312R [Iridovirus Liz-CrIV]QNH08722.1 312R [Invertebrate iridescent virus Kaz2018]UIB20727.1 putative protein 312R [Cricket iridovirus]AAK82173.1 312R [Invertebrate iridescent virus 6]QMS79753.1 hypothetical protein IIV6-T1_306 [Invertebrate iridescent virus 6]